jgi:hypothetical protein
MNGEGEEKEVVDDEEGKERVEDGVKVKVRGRSVPLARLEEKEIAKRRKGSRSLVPFDVANPKRRSVSALPCLKAGSLIGRSDFTFADPFAIHCLVSTTPPVQSSQRIAPYSQLFGSITCSISIHENEVIAISASCMLFFPCLAI